MDNSKHSGVRPNRTRIVVFAAVLIFIAGAIFGQVTLRWFASIDQPSGLQWELTEAARAGNVRKLDALAAQGADVNSGWVAGGVSSFSPLADTVDSLQVESTRWLLEHGADPDSVISDGTPRGWAKHNLAKAGEIVELMNQYPNRRNNK